ncbi:MAG: hypothetical protein HKN52_08680, partial [Eudoraea sp.]|nr:hypothetical protein [Eudoraea sp.]
ISGFAIYGLFMMIEPIETSNLEAQNEENIYLIFLFQGLLVSWYILTINLIAHVILRGLWIGAIGLRYVSGDIDYEHLKYSPKFTKHLEKRVGSFDNYVATLEKYCSVIFAVTFLLVFYLLGLLIIVVILSLLGLSADKVETPDWVRFGIVMPLIVFISIGMIITFIDFITQGWLKKKKWTTIFYFPIYWVFKYLTLSFLYRPMVYNLLDTKFGKRLSMVIVPLYLGLALLAGTGFSRSNYLDEDLNSNSYTASSDNYQDLIDVNSSFADRASIESKIINESFLNVFVVYGSSVEDDVFYFNKELEPEEDKRGIYSSFSRGTIKWSERGELMGDYLKTIEDMYTLSVDSIPYKPQFVVAENTQGQLGFETFLDLTAIDRGKHVMNVARKDHINDSTYMRTIINIPFWYYPE